jgi:hypothetical protein
MSFTKCAEEPLCGGLSSALTDADYEFTAGGVDHVVGNDGQVVDLENTLDL